MIKPALFFLAMSVSWMGLTGQRVTKVTVLSVPLSISYTWEISCKEFDRTFNDIKKKVILTQTTKIKELTLALSKFKLTTLAGIDVRGKLFVCSSGKKLKVICFDELGNFFIDGNFFENKTLFNFLLLNKFITWQ